MWTYYVSLFCIFFSLLWMLLCSLCCSDNKYHMTNVEFCDNLFQIYGFDNRTRKYLHLVMEGCGELLLNHHSNDGNVIKQSLFFARN
jgi:hypothetical protein